MSPPAASAARERSRSRSPEMPVTAPGRPRKELEVLAEKAGKVEGFAL